MKELSFIVFLLSTTASAQILDLRVRDIRRIGSEEGKTVTNYLKTPGRIIYISSSYTDSIFFELVNKYRTTTDFKLNELGHSRRLDSLSHIFIRKLAAYSDLRHYSAMPEMKDVCDLLNVENIAYRFSSNSINRGSNIFINPNTDELKEYLQGWIDSPAHNRNMLEDLTSGSAKILLKVSNKDDGYSVETYVVLEIDNSYSKRELNQAYKRKNWELHHSLEKRWKRLRKASN